MIDDDESSLFEKQLFNDTLLVNGSLSQWLSDADADAAIALYQELTILTMSYSNATTLNATMNDASQLPLMPSSFVRSNDDDLVNFNSTENSFRQRLREFLLESISECQRALEANVTVCNRWESVAFKYVFPFLLIISIIGNSLALIVYYRSKFLKNTSTVTLLALKSQANLAGVCFLSMEMFKRYDTSGKNSKFEHFYWYTWSYFLFFVNVFGTFAVWCTLIITLETYLCIAYPIHFRRWANQRRVYVIILVMFSLDIVHHLALPITRTTNEYSVCYDTVKVYQIHIRNSSAIFTYEKLYYYVQSVTVIVFPNLAMLLFCVLIGFEFRSKNVGHCFSNRRRCVLRLTITTTICYCVLETPHVFVLLAVAARGSGFEENESLCIFNVITNFLSISNAAIPFVVYVTCNSTFRQLLWTQLANIAANEQRRRSSFALAGSELRRLSTRLSSPSNGYLLGTNQRHMTF